MANSLATTSVLGRFLLLVPAIVLRKEYAVSAGMATELKLIPAGSPFDIVEYDHDDIMMMEVTTPETTSVICTSEKNPMESSRMRKICGGIMNFDLSASDNLDITFEAPPGFEIQMDTTEAMKFEFSSHIMDEDVECGSRQEFQGGKDFVPTLKGSAIDGLSFNAQTSFLRLDACEVYMSVQFDGSSDVADARVRSVSWTVQYDSSLVQEGMHSYHYATDGLMNIKATNVKLVPEEAAELVSSNLNSGEDAITDGPSSEIERLRGSPTSPAVGTHPSVTHPSLAVACACALVVALSFAI